MQQKGDHVLEAAAALFWEDYLALSIHFFSGTGREWSD
jgi:hypothetical protein